MRTYLIEDIYDEDYDKIINAFNELEFNGSVDGIYYIPLPDDMLEQEQIDHMDEDGPFFLALEAIKAVSGNQLKMELLVRARKKIRCSCVCYCSAKQRKHMIEYLDNFISELGIYC